MILERPDRSLPGAREIARGLDRHNITNGITAFLFATTGPLAIFIGVGTEGGMGQADLSSWIFGAYGVGGVLSLIFCLLYRQPLGLAWTIPGMVLLGSALDHLPFSEVVGAFIVTAGLLFLLGVTGWVGKIMNAIPLPVVMGMVAGVFLPLAVRIVTAFEEAAVIALVTLVAFVAISLAPAFARVFPPVLGALAAGAAATVATGSYQLQAPLAWSVVEPVFYAPAFSLQACFELVVPLAVTVVGIQNAQGFAILRDAKFDPPANMLTLACGIGSLAAAAVGSVSTCVTGPVNGILNSSGERDLRYVGGLVFGVLMILFAVFSPVATSLALAMPAAFIGMLGGLALLRVLQGAFATAFGSRFQLGALVAFMVTVSGISIFNIGAAFWGLVFGYLTSAVLEWPSFRAHREGK